MGAGTGGCSTGGGGVLARVSSGLFLDIGCFYKLGVLLAGVLRTKAVIFWLNIWAPDVWKLSYSLPYSLDQPENVGLVWLSAGSELVPIARVQNISPSNSRIRHKALHKVGIQNLGNHRRH